MEVLYEDNHLIGVKKPAGLLVQGDCSRGPSLIEEVRGYLRTKYQKPGNVFVGLLHRLDRPVGGVVLFAKTSKGASRLSAQFRNRTIRKTYHALVEGTPRDKEATLIHHLGEGTERVQVSETPNEKSKQAELSYRVLHSGKTFSLLEVTLKTGRKHQIRAQLAHIGHPLAGDKKYGAKEEFKSEGIGLRASLLEFDHPVMPGRKILLVDPDDAMKAWKTWL